MTSSPPPPRQEDPAGASTVRFAEAARALAAAARRFGLAAPTFRTPPRLVGLDRTVRRHAKGGVVSVRVRARPWPAVLADMVDGVIAVNVLDPRRASRARADLWEVVTRQRPATVPTPRIPVPRRNVA